MDASGTQVVGRHDRRHPAPAAAALRLASAIPSPPSTPLVGRAEELSRARDLLAEGSGGGLVVHGVPGAGTTTFVRHVLEALGPDVASVSMRGSATSGDVPFGAVMALVRDLGEEPAGHLLHAVRSALEHVAQAKSSRSVVLVVHGAQYVDPSSALVLATLASTSSCQVLLVTDALDHLPGDLAVLVRDGVLARVPLRALTPEESAVVLGSRLGAPLVPRLVEDLWAATSGHPRAVEALADHLTAHPGDLTLGPMHLCRWGDHPLPLLEAALPTAEALLTAPERDLLDALALADGLPLRHLHRIGLPGVLDDLLASRLAVVDAGQTVRPLNRVVAAALRGRV